MFKKSRILLLVCAIILLVQAPVSTLAQSDSGRQPVVLSEEEAYRKDAKAYVAAFGGTVDEAVRRLKLQGTIQELDETLQTQESATFAGLWIEHIPRFRVVVQLTRGGKEVVLPHIPEGPLADLVETQNASISLKQLRAAHANVIRDIQTTGILTESDIDLQANKIKVYTTNRKQLEAALSTMGHRLPADVQVVEIAKLSQPIADWYAGLSLAGGYCTSGFSLRTAAYVKYSSTAAHCNGRNSPLPLPPIFMKWVGAYDFEVHSAPAGYTIKNWAMDNKVPPLYRQITSWWSTAPVGAALCKYGATTGKCQWEWDNSVTSLV